MKKANRVFKTIIYIVLISLACLGVGLSGGVPLPSIRIKRNSNVDKIELVENKKQSNDSDTLK